MLEDFRHVTHYRVPFSDLDCMQHVNHLAHARWAETARTEYFVEVLGESVNGERGFILVNLNFTYERQLDFRERIVIGTRVSRIGRRSFDFLYEIVSEERKLPAAHGLTTMVAYDYLRHASIVVPSEWREKIALFEIVPPK
jgi:acyl-CoA thioester hydrolase